MARRGVEQFQLTDLHDAQKNRVLSVRHLRELGATDCQRWRTFRSLSTRL